MTRNFCDKCGEEVKRITRMKRAIGKFAIEVIHSIDGSSNVGHLCDKCITLIVNKGKAPK